MMKRSSCEPKKTAPLLPGLLSSRSAASPQMLRAWHACVGAPRSQAQDYELAAAVELARRTAGRAALLGEDTISAAAARDLAEVAATLDLALQRRRRVGADESERARLGMLHVLRCGHNADLREEESWRLSSWIRTEFLT